eukprot:Em0079g3a
MVQYYGDPRREDAECVVTSQRRLEKREIVMRVHVQQSTYTVLYLAKTKDTSYDVAKAWRQLQASGEDISSCIQFCITERHIFTDSITFVTDVDLT